MRAFRLEVPAGFEFSRDVVGAWAAEAPQRVALVAADPSGQRLREVTFADLALARNRVANALRGLGFQAGDRGFVMLPRIPEWHETLLGMMAVGMVAAPATVLCTPRD